MIDNTILGDPTEGRILDFVENAEDNEFFVIKTENNLIKALSHERIDNAEIFNLQPGYDFRPGCKAMITQIPDSYKDLENDKFKVFGVEEIKKFMAV